MRRTGNDRTEADARPKMLFYLLENKIVTLSEWAPEAAYELRRTGY